MSFTGITNMGGKTTYWINDKEVSREEWEKYQDTLKKRKR